MERRGRGKRGGWSGGGGRRGRGGGNKGGEKREGREEDGEEREREERGMERRGREEREREEMGSEKRDREEWDEEEGDRGGKRDLMSFTIPPAYFVSVQLNCMLNMHSPVVHIAVVGWWYSSAMSVPSPVAKQNSILVNLASVMLTECT